MMSQNGGKKNKLRVRFLLLYIFSILLLSVIFVGIWNMFENTPSKTAVQPQAITVYQDNLLQKQNILLQAPLKNIQLLNAAYFKLHTASADKKKQDSINSLINIAELALGNTIDSLQKNKDNLPIDDKEKLDSILSDATMALNNNRSIDLMRNSLPEETKNMSDSGKALYAMQTQLIVKNEKITELENQLKTTGNVHSSEGNSQAELMQQIAQLKDNIEKLKNANSDLETQNASITKNNSQLTSQVNEFKNNSSTSVNSRKSDQAKTDVLNNKIADLNAQLIFAQVDCNLSKADSKQIISNSKQRKDLLQGSLALLNNLSHSDNVFVQKRVKEKLNQLQNIAATVRD